MRSRKHFRRFESHQYDHTSGFQTIWYSSCNRALSGKFVSFLEKHIFFLSKLLKKSLLSHQLNQALAALIGLCGRCENVPELFYITGLEVLKSIPSTHMICVQFYKNMFLACPGHQQEILLNFALYLVQKQQDVTGGLELLKSKSSKVNFNNNLLHKAYIGLFESLNWQPRQDLSSHHVLLSDDEHDELGEQSRSIMIDYTAKNAIYVFEDAFSKPGIWDIFIPAYLHLLQHCKGASYAKECLLTYRNMNKLNPNPHRYLYHFLKLNLGSTAELIKVLEDLVELDTTSELLGELVDLKMKIGDTAKVIEMIFQKLDHAGCMWDEETWKLLNTYLAVNNNDIKRDVVMAWKERESWWPQYHFRVTRNFDILAKKNVMLVKANVAEYFLGENDFTKKVYLVCEKDHVVRPTSNKPDDIKDTKRITKKRQINDSNTKPQIKRIKKR